MLKKQIKIGIISIVVVIALIFSVMLVIFSNEEDNDSDNGNVNSKFLGSWQPDEIIMGGGNSEETWTFIEVGKVNVVVTHDTEESTNYFYNWEEKNGELIIISPLAPEYTIKGDFEFINDDTAFIWNPYYQNDPSNIHPVTFYKI